MHICFIELCKPQFTELVAKYYMSVEHPELLSSPLDLTVNNSSTLNANELSNHVTSEHSLGTSSSEEVTAPVSGFIEPFWNELLLSLEATASLELPKRFDVVAKSLRLSVLDNPTLSRDPKLVGRLESFTEALSPSLHDTWCANRDACLIHSDTTHLLGRASKVIYTFLRHTLKVPMLASTKIMTPTTQDAESTQAPTVGSYTGAVYRALRDGMLIEAVIGLLPPRK
ncbi:hypothetical protein GGR58DRAFT_305862 [Xylaria digitata]|nr:hypothetical protein GGR58DRAFT_305862 [Xylaria digitata]